MNKYNYRLKIKKYRELKGLTQKELAQKIGISRSYFADLENGKYDIKLSMLIKTSKVLRVVPSKLIEYK